VSRAAPLRETGRSGAGWILFAIFVLALLLRLWDLWQPFAGDYAWNEALYAGIARGFFERGMWEQVAPESGPIVLSPPLVPWLVHSSFRVFGVHEWAARLVPLACGMTSLWFLYLFVRDRLGGRTALAATLLASTAPGIVFYSRALQLDSTMTMFGLAAMVALDRYRRTARTAWMALACAVAALTVGSKFSGILFWPALTWIWLEDRGDGASPPRLWSWLAFSAVALLPALGWLAYAATHPITPGAHPSADSYLLRSAEWTAANFSSALLALWPKLLDQLGTVGMVVLALLGPFALLQPPPAATTRRFAPFLLLAAPWWLQMLYPYSWAVNSYYIYPSLYPLSVFTAAFALHAHEAMSRARGLTSRRALVAAAVCIGIAVIGNAWDYRDGFHASYHPWPRVRQPERFYSARRVAVLNTAHAPVLADVLTTLYYAEADPTNSVFQWWNASEKPMIDAVRSRKFEFIAFDHPAPLPILDAIREAGYVQIAPAAWRRTQPPP